MNNNYDSDLIENGENDVIEEIVPKTLECGTHLRVSGTIDKVK